MPPLPVRSGARRRSDRCQCWVWSRGGELGRKALAEHARTRPGSFLGFAESYHSTPRVPPSPDSVIPAKAGTHPAVEPAPFPAPALPNQTRANQTKSAPRRRGLLALVWPHRTARRKRALDPPSRTRCGAASKGRWGAPRAENQNRPTPLQEVGRAVSRASWRRPIFRKGLPPQYRRRCGVSLPCSGWERVVPPRNDHQLNQNRSTSKHPSR